MMSRRGSRFNTQPPEGGWGAAVGQGVGIHGFNTQPPEGGWVYEQARALIEQGFNTQPPEGGWLLNPNILFHQALFQHTAARRRLEIR